MVSTSEVSVSLTVDSNEKLPAIAAELGQLADVKYEGKKALVCMVGEGIFAANRASPRRCSAAIPPHQRAHDLAGRVARST